MAVPLVVAVFIALGIGLLIGIEREWSDPGTPFAGSRTLPLIAGFGALVQAFFPNLLPIAVVLVGGLVVVAYVSKVATTGDIGMTTAVATMLTFVYGAMATHSDTGLRLAVVLGTVTMALLAEKRAIHEFADRLDEAEMRASLKFLIVALVVFPLLPSERIAALGGLDFRFVWLMVVFVSGISLSGYVLAKLVGSEVGFEVTGALGGLVSSTATAVSMAENARRDDSLTGLCGIATVIASLAMFVRILLEVLVVNPALFVPVVVPITGMTVVGVVVAAVEYRGIRGDAPLAADIENLFRLWPALLFGVFFALVLVASAALSAEFGAVGVYSIAIVSGLVDINAITISLSNLSRSGDISTATATGGIVLAASVNTAVKIAVVWLFGTRALGRTVVVVLGVVAAVGIGFVVL
ncbi:MULTISPECIES: MgtC/SapB family protein [unclassified Haladaptatus]|uniref:MgtC/SapB family protein n=1 Tax=unclassified Haladaptatus TaxID=2622732 RepID=UPI00209BF6D7|nr:MULTISPECIES: MgtC/SapB family protein [unclassified Haladaptatus]MCO8246552.1 MgtC/SapB family protein [Haladaptatus sp. AB643]MCO8254790.1 MgtC/SapB family protein [Haladaptatus sp. AB618]